MRLVKDPLIEYEENLVKQIEINIGGRMEALGPNERLNQKRFNGWFYAPLLAQVRDASKEMGITMKELTQLAWIRILNDFKKNK